MNDRSMLGYEMSRTPSRSSVVTFTNNDAAHPDARPKDGHRLTKVHDRFGLLRHFRLQFFAFLVSLFAKTKWNANTEYRKVAIHHNRAVATAHSLLHLIPLAGAMILLILQWNNYWVGYEDEISTALQFAAKVHELAMQASMVEVLLCLIRTRLVNDVVPLGALACAMQATQLSYLWSLDFFSIFRSRALKGWRRIIVIVTIPIIVSLVSVVGPSSAVLMIPRPNSPSIAHTVTVYMNQSADMLYPSHSNLEEEQQGL
ncbi:hypothetical protein E8E13_002328 [Curvularia kusanoi]|uniref:Uncharacterized protein n=1 Tax=Curvularia kusanoi TaxID=90978 RepID=A0A9P4T3L6_CURKU|nr:hypothetical protein E8E13_002328 [Curvularia kusanoi]